MKQFEKIPISAPKKSVFDLSHERKMTINMGELVPSFIQEVIPGDSFKVDFEALLRFQPLLAPIMHRVNVYQHFFFVPNRIVWNEWEEFITGGRSGNLDPVHPVFTGNLSDFKLVMTLGGLADYLGVPVQNFTNTAMPSPDISQLPFRAYQQIYNDYYRDQNLSDEVDFSKGTHYDFASDLNPNFVKLNTLRKRAWEKDYFTSALPWAQRGGDVNLPIGSIAPVTSTVSPQLYNVTKSAFPITVDVQTNALGNIVDPTNPNDVYQIHGQYADLSNATSSTVTEVRRAFALQRWLEKMARGGARYIEQMLTIFNVKSSDARLQRAEYLGGGKMPVKISEVLQTSATEVGSAQANMAGHGFASGQTAGFTKTFEEHGFIIGILSVMPRTAYQEGLPRIFSKFDRFDYYWPDFAHIGEQAILSKELYLSDTTTSENTFGYQPRYAEYRYGIDTVHGDLRASLAFWHLGRIFGGMPVLNQDFIECNQANDDLTRIYPVEDMTFQKLIVQTYANVRAIRPVSKYGEPI